MYKKTAIVYDWIDKWGGVERVLLALHRMFPEAPFYTSTYNRQSASWAEPFHVQPSFLQHIARAVQKRALLVPLYPIAFESFDFSEYEQVISVTSSFAKGIITKPSTFHLSYILTPPRFLWSHRDFYAHKVFRLIGTPLYSHLSDWDMAAIRRPDKLITISDESRRRCQKTYQIDVPVIYPPFDTQYWNKVRMRQTAPRSFTPQHFYLTVGRMERYKRFDLLMQAARLLPEQTFVYVGAGTERQRLMANAPPNCHFLTHLTDYELSYLYSHADAFLMPQEEDFGYVALEAEYHGCPVLAYGAGGACETVEDGLTGTFFRSQTADALVAELARMSKISYNLKHSLESVRNRIQNTFGEERFSTEFFYQLSNH